VSPGSRPRSNKLLIALIAVAGVLLLAVVAITFWAVGRGGATPAGDGDPVSAPIVTSTTSPTPTTAPAGDNNGNGNSGSNNNGGGGGSSDTTVRFTSFDYNPNVACDPTGEDEKPSPSISWSSVNAVAVYWTPANREANASNGYQVGASGNQDTLSASKGPGERYEFPCNHDQYFDTTITLVGADGQTVSQTARFVDVNWGSGGDDD